MSKKDQTEPESSQYKHYCKKGRNNYTQSNALYGLGIIGVAVYYLQHATTFWMGVIGIIKAVFWPALILYKVFEMLKIQ